MVTLRIILILVAFVVLLVIGFQNAKTATDVVWFDRVFSDTSLSIVMLYSFAFGALCVGIFTVISEVRLRAKLRRQRKETEALMEELRAFRNAPLEEGKVQPATRMNTASETTED